MTFATVEGLAQDFVTSITATAIRLVQHGSFPAMLVWSEREKRKWFIRGPEIPIVLWPRDQPREDTVAHELLEGKSVSKSPLEIYGDSWIDHPDARRYSIVEDSIEVREGQVLTLLWWKDERPLLHITAQEEDGERDY